MVQYGRLRREGTPALTLTWNGWLAVCMYVIFQAGKMHSKQNMALIKSTYISTHE
jgi:hypothetical protein